MAQTHFTTEQEQLIVQSIKEAEKKTSGEIRVHIENHCDVDLLDRAADVFALLGMHKTALRNGVLFYIAMEDHKFAILGDAGINSKVPSGYWNQIKEVMRQYFIQKDFTGVYVKALN